MVGEAVEAFDDCGAGEGGARGGDIEVEGYMGVGDCVVVAGGSEREFSGLGFAGSSDWCLQKCSCANVRWNGRAIVGCQKQIYGVVHRRQKGPVRQIADMEKNNAPKCDNDLHRV